MGNPPLRIDGQLDENVWQQAPLHTHFAQKAPKANGAVPEGLRTQVQVVVDGHALVIGVRAWSTEPPRVVLSRRDAVDADQDMIGVWLDTGGRRESALFVKASLAGVVSDGLYNAANDEDDLGPDFPVQVGVVHLPDGYSLEIRWPLAALRYPYNGERPWQMLVARAVPASDDLLLVSGAVDSGALNGLHASLPLQGLRPVLQRHQDQTETQAMLEWTGRRMAVGGSSSQEGSLGMEAWWRPRADWIVNATLNPDFAQVEIDAPQASGNRAVALALPEKRRYFLESADVLGLTVPAFYSRTVADPRWGLRGTWRGARADASALLLEDRAGALVQRGRPWSTETWTLDAPSQAQLLRGRWQHDLTDGALTQGLMWARRALNDSRQNQVVGTDGLWRNSRGGRHLQAQWSLMASENTVAVDPEGVTRAREQNPERGWRAWAKGLHSDERWFNIAEASVTTPGFVNLLGFGDLAGLWQAHLELNRRLGEQHLPLGANGWTLHETELHLGLAELRSLRDSSRGEPGGELIHRELRVGGWFTTAGRTAAWLHVGADTQRARSGGVLHPTPALHGGLETSPWPWLARLTAEGSWGRQLDNERDRVGTGGWWSVQANTRWALPAGRSLELDPVFTGLHIAAENGQQALTDTGVRLLGLYHLNASSSLRAIVQHQRTVRTASGAEPAIGERSRHRSLMWRQRLHPQWQLSTGWQWDQATRAPTRRELFIKLQWTAGSA